MKPLKISAYSIWKNVDYFEKYFMTFDCTKHSRYVKLKQPYAQSQMFVSEWINKRWKYMYKKVGFNNMKISNILILMINILICKCIYLYLKKNKEKRLRTVIFARR